MKSFKIGLLIVCIVSISCFWIIPEGKKIVTEWKELQRIKAVREAVDQLMKDKGLKIVPVRKFAQSKYEC